MNTEPQPKKLVKRADYFNTTNLSGADLEQARAKCRGQEAEVLAIFQSYNSGEYSPELIHSRYNWIHYKWQTDKHTPLTSIRRAITNLTKKGLLVKTDKKVRGQYGKLTYTWRLAD